jgi:hypothetical protein
LVTKKAPSPVRFNGDWASSNSLILHFHCTFADSDRGFGLHPLLHSTARSLWRRSRNGSGLWSTIGWGVIFIGSFAGNAGTPSGIACFDLFGGSDGLFYSRFSFLYSISGSKPQKITPFEFSPFELAPKSYAFLLARRKLRFNLAFILIKLAFR